MAILLLSLTSITGFLVACQGQPDTVSIRFAASKLPTPGIEIRDLRFYVHQVELLTDAGQFQGVNLAAIAPWQSERVALIDLASAAGNRAVQGVVDRGNQPRARYIGIRFTVGVPFELNHANPLIAAAPLDRTDLFWNWNSGYKFMRVDLGERERDWSFHLGSTGCSSESALRPPASPCAQPNTMRIEVRGFDPSQQPLYLNVNELANAMHAANFAACTGDYQHNAACAGAYSKTGLDVLSGQCEAGVCKSQSLFGVE
jgi:uncharacterized repeat protein (TIGR04052 family)